MCPFRVRARVADMDLPVAPPAFDATTGSGRRRRADLGADIGAGCGLVVLELIALVVVLGLWFLSGFDLDPAESAAPDPCGTTWPPSAASGPSPGWRPRSPRGPGPW